MTIIPSDGASPFDAIRRVREDGSEYWSARELMPLLGYAKWHRFADAVEQARAVVEAEDGPAAAEREASRCREAFGRTRQAGDNVHLSRRACYLTAMRGDSRKPEIRAALLYFAQKTREAETGSASLELAMRVISLQDRVLALAASNSDLARKVADLAPKAEGYDDLIASEGCFDMSSVAKILSPVTGNIGRTRLLNLLRGMGIILQGSTLPEQKYIERGYFQVRTDIVNGKAVASTVATPKGLRWLQFELREDRPTLQRTADRNVLHLPSGQDGGAA